MVGDRKSTRLNSSHSQISYAVFCLKKKKADTFTVQEKPLCRFCEQVLTNLSVPAEDARVTTDVLVLADLLGIDSHGVARLGRYVNGLKQGTMKATDQSRIIREAKATALVDGGQSLGQ